MVLGFKERVGRSRWVLLRCGIPIHGFFFERFFVFLVGKGKRCMIMTDIGISTRGLNILFKLIPPLKCLVDIQFW